jgi:hypothetical protein
VIHHFMLESDSVRFKILGFELSVECTVVHREQRIRETHDVVRNSHNRGFVQP